MHQALNIEEILINIFGHCFDDTISTFDECCASLAALARTCRAFKDPALDVLWTELDDLTPLARCLPEACCKDYDKDCYSFTRPLREAEWATLRSYTRRVWRVWNMSSMTRCGGLDEDTINVLRDSLHTEPLFPNLRYLRWKGAEPLPLLRHWSAARLTGINFGLAFSAISPMKDILHSLGDLFPDVKEFTIHNSGRVPSDIDLNAIISRQLRRWTNLKSVDCHNITLDTDVFSHLSRMPALQTMLFTLSAISAPPPDVFFVFPKLRTLAMKAESLSLVPSFLARLSSPALVTFSASFKSYDCNQTVHSSLMAVRKMTTNTSITSLSFFQHGAFSDSHPLAFEDLRPCMAFSNLRYINIELKSETVDLTDRDFLELTSAWPNLKAFFLNQNWGWRTPGGITPAGLVRFLQQCRSLRSFCLAIDTRNLTGNVPHLSSDIVLPQPVSFGMDIVDSAIEPDSVPALAAFFGEFIPCPKFSYTVWNGMAIYDRADSEIPRNLWRKVFRLASERVRERFQVSPSTRVHGEYIIGDCSKGILDDFGGPHSWLG